MSPDNGDEYAQSDDWFLHRVGKNIPRNMIIIPNLWNV
mgnify:FL=1